jgi:hypothetical protein
VNNTEKLDDIRRRLRVIETRLNIIQQAIVVVFERVTCRHFPENWLISDVERKILDGAGAAGGDASRGGLATREAVPPQA